MTQKKLNRFEFNKSMDKDKSPDINQNHIIMGFFEFDFSPDTFTKELGLEPLYKGVRGDKYLVGSKKQHEKVHEYNVWTHEIKTYSNEFIGDLIERYIEEIIIPRLGTIKRLTSNCNVQFRIAQYYYDGCNPGVYIKREHNKILVDINSSIDIDIYCLGE